MSARGMGLPARLRPPPPATSRHSTHISDTTARTAQMDCTRKLFIMNWFSLWQIQTSSFR
jgi:hypothetical protein